ncbi:MAG: MFS transporter [Acidimicrobiales bacterium]
MPSSIDQPCVETLDVRLGSDHHPHPAPRALAFWLVAVAFAVAMLGTTLPTPLYVIYQAQWHFAAGVTTVVYAMYALGVLISLLFLGRVSDQIGRRPVWAGALALAAVSTVIFILATDVAMLMVARALSGLAAGVVTGTATAALSELVRDGNGRRAALIATTVNMGGLGLGPLLAGFLAQYAPAPTVLVFLVYIGLLVVAAAAIWVVPETVTSRGRLSLRFSGLGVPANVRCEFASAGLAAFCAFTLLGLFSALAPSFLGGVLHEHNEALGGAVVFLIFATAVATQLALHRLASRVAMGAGLGWLLAGLAVIMVGLSQASLLAFVLGTAVSGVGVGLVFMGSLATANRLAPPERRGQVVSTYFVAAYLGLIIPVIGVGVASQHVGDFRATLVCSIVVAVLVAIAGGSLAKDTSGKRSRLE